MKLHSKTVMDWFLRQLQFVKRICCLILWIRSTDPSSRQTNCSCPQTQSKIVYMHINSVDNDINKQQRILHFIKPSLHYFIAGINFYKKKIKWCIAFYDEKSIRKENYKLYQCFKRVADWKRQMIIYLLVTYKLKSIGRIVRLSVNFYLLVMLILLQFHYHF